MSVKALPPAIDIIDIRDDDDDDDSTTTQQEIIDILSDGNSSSEADEVSPRQDRSPPRVARKRQKPDRFVESKHFDSNMPHKKDGLGKQQRHPESQSAGKKSGVGGKRRFRCGSCDNCLKEDCGSCWKCEIRKKTNKSRGACIRKPCLNLQDQKTIGAQKWSASSESAA